MFNLVKQAIRPLTERTRLALNYPYVYGNFNISRKDYFEWYLKHCKRLTKFKNIHQEEDCFIIGNGPSLNKMDLSALKNHYTFGLNKIYLIFDRVDLDLSYHVSVNPLVIKQSVKEFESLDCPSFLSYQYAHNYFDQLDNIYFLLTQNQCTFESNLVKGVYEGYTVTYVAMQIAFYMGFKRVFLIGVDHNFTAIGNPNEKQRLKGEDPNHFSPQYFGNQEWHLPDLEGSELAYSMAKFHFNRANCQIYDATVDGKLQIFPKISYEQALNECSQKSQINCIS